jgi:hypothetical protein
MLNYEEKVYLVKKVDCFALSDMRVKALPDFFRTFSRDFSLGEITQIADLLYLNKQTVGKCMVDTRSA